MGASYIELIGLSQPLHPEELPMISYHPQEDTNRKKLEEFQPYVGVSRDFLYFLVRVSQFLQDGRCGDSLTIGLFSRATTFSMLHSGLRVTFVYVN